MEQALDSDDDYGGVYQIPLGHVEMEESLPN